MMFMLISMAIALAVVLLLLRPLRTSAADLPVVERDSVNVEVAAQRLLELKQELQDGRINEEQFQRYRHELELAALEDLQAEEVPLAGTHHKNTALAVFIALTIPLSSLFIYEKIGHGAMHDEAGQASVADTADNMAELEEAIARAEADIKSKPDDVEGRLALGQVYTELQRYEDAARMYSQLYALQPENADILVTYAETLARVHGNRFKGKPAELLTAALRLNPDHQRALWLAGFAALQNNNSEASLQHWRHLLSALEPDSEIYRQVEKLVAETAASAQNAPQAAEPRVAAAASDGESGRLEVQVSLAPELKARMDASSTLFVYARAAEGPPMPLAVHRALATDLPLTVTLDDSMAMMPQMSLSQFPRVIVGARLSVSGQAQGQSGDLEGISDVIELSGRTGVSIVIDSIKP